MQKNNDSIIFNNLQDIIHGFTRFNDLYIKHFDFCDEAALAAFYDKEIERLTEIPTQEEQLELLFDKGIWKKSQEGDLTLKKVRLKAAETTLPNLLIKSQRKPVESKIAELSGEISELEVEKSEYMGITREDIANTNSYEHIICLSVFRDIDFKIPHFPNQEKDLDDITTEELMDSQMAVIETRILCGIDSCKKIASSHHAQAIVNCLPEDHEYKLINRPVHTFTVPQINLIQYCSVFRKILNKYTIPDEIADDPDKILEFPKQARKIEDMRQKHGGGDLGSGKSYLGATSEEMNDMGMKGVDIHHLLDKSGKKSLSKHDLL